MNSKGKRFLGNALLLVITMAVCFSILEWWLARYYSNNLAGVEYKGFDPELGWINLPGRYSIKPIHSFKTHDVYINEYGLRNRDGSKGKNDGATRIIILGDSFTFASGVRTEEMFSTRIEKALNRDGSGKYETINAGVEGYGTIQGLLLMRRLAAQDVIGEIYLLMVFVNDILDNLCLSYGDATENMVQPKYVVDINNRLVLKRPPQKSHMNTGNEVSPNRGKVNIVLFETVKAKILTFLQTKPSLIRLLNRIGIEAPFPRMPGVINGWYDEQLLREGVPLLLKSIEEIKKETEKRGAKLYVSLIPSPLQVYPGTYGPLLEKTFPKNVLVERFLNNNLVPQDIVKGICKELDIPFLDLYPALAKKDNRQLYIPNDGHFTREAHAIAAESIEKFISSHIWSADEG